MVEEPKETTPPAPDKVEDDKTPDKPQSNEDIQKLAQSVEKVIEVVKQQSENFKKQFDGIAFKIRQLDDNKPTTPTSEPTDDFNYDETDEVKKLRDDVKRLEEQPKKASLGYEQEAKQRVIAEANKRGIDLSDEFAWNEFVGGNMADNDPNKRPLLTYRTNPQTRLYTSSEAAYGDIIEHLNKRHPLKSDDNPDKTMDNVADTTPSSDTTVNENRTSKRFNLTDEEKAVAKAMGKTEEEYVKLKQGEVSEFNVTGEER